MPLIIPIPMITNERPFTCDLCESTFNRKSALANHLKKIREIISSKKGHWEGKKDRSSKKLGIAMESCHGVRIRLHSHEKQERCLECQRSFGNSEKCYKVLYSECDQSICMECVIKADGIGCGHWAVYNGKC